MSAWQVAAAANVAVGVACAVLALRALRECLRARRRLGLEINDGIVQGLARVKWALEAHRDEEAQAAADETLAEAQRMVSGLLMPRATASAPPAGRLRR